MKNVSRSLVTPVKKNRAGVRSQSVQIKDKIQYGGYNVYGIKKPFGDDASVQSCISSMKNMNKVMSEKNFRKEHTSTLDNSLVVEEFEGDYQF
jgi:hypothetical protein